ncbi:MAG: hypothetical protein ACLGI8_02940 [Acidimicrobiia bacterium]
MAVVRDDPPSVFIAEDMDIMNWVLALRLVARTPAAQLEPALRDELRAALLEERWADAVYAWMDAMEVEVDVYASEDLFTARDVEFAATELQFSPLFDDEE